MTIEDDKQKKAEFLLCAHCALETMTNCIEDIVSYMKEYSESDDFWLQSDDPGRPWDSFDALIEEAVILKRTAWNHVESCLGEIISEAPKL